MRPGPRFEFFASGSIHWPGSGEYGSPIRLRAIVLAAEEPGAIFGSTTFNATETTRNSGNQTFG